MNRFALLALLLPTTAAAQAAADSAGRRSSLSARVASLGEGTTLRVSTRSRERVEGRILRRSDSTLTLAGAGLGDAGRTLPFAAIDTLWERGNAVGAGLVVGGLLGGGGVAILACQPSCKESGVIPFAFLTGFLGAGFGAMLGSTARRWQQRFP